MWKSVIILFAIFSKYSNGAILNVEKGCEIGGPTWCENLDFSNAHEITIQSDRHYPETEMLEFQSSKVPVVPRDLFVVFPNIDDCSLFEVGLRKIDREDFAGANKLKTLLLGSNQLEELPGNVFANAKNLSFLSIEDNQISRMDPTTFSGLSRLETLKIQNNQIHELPVGILDDLESLTSFEMGKNQLEVIDENLFRNNHQLQLIHLEENRIKQIGRNTFMHLRQLQQLQLYGNNFKELYTASVNYLLAQNGSIEKLIVNGSVDYIVIGSNQVDEIQITNISGALWITLGVKSTVDLTFLKDARSVQSLNFEGGSPNLNNPEIFQNKPNLKEISVTNADFQAIPANTFRQVKTLKAVIIRNTTLKNVNVEELVAIDKLDVLILAYNQIEEFDYRTLFDNAKKLKAIDLTGNKFKCSYLAELLAYKKTKNIKAFIFENGQFIVEPNEHQFGCV